MRWSRVVTTEVMVTPWQDYGHFGQARVRIWVQTDGTRWWQCHEWERQGGNGERWHESWIPSLRRWPTNAIEPEPGEGIPADE